MDGLECEVFLEHAFEVVILYFTVLVGKLSTTRRKTAALIHDL
jgi:hypothetical protein